MTTSHTMKATRNFSWLAALALIAGCGKFGGEQSVAEAGKQQWPMVQKYCSDCHNDSELAGNIDFAKINPDNVAQHAATLEMAVRKLRSHAMPPPKEPRPDAKQLTAFVAWLERALDDAAVNTHGYQAIVPHR